MGTAGEEYRLMYWINTTLNEFGGLDLKTAKSLSLVSHLVFKTVKKYLEENCWFSITIGKRLKWYAPRKQKNVCKGTEIAISTKVVEFLHSFNAPINLSKYENITTIAFGMSYNQVDFLLPPNLTHVIFNEDYNQPIQNLPPTITHLTFRFAFNQSVDHLPPNLTHLTFNSTSEFNQPVDNLPRNLVCLNLDGDRFNSPIDKLPTSLTRLSVNSYDFNRSVDNLFLPNLQHLKLAGFTFNQKIDNLLTPKLTHLWLGHNFNRQITKLPQNIIYLSLGNHFNFPISSLNLPPNLINLEVGVYFNQYIASLPPKVSQVLFFDSLCLEIEFNHPISHLNQAISFKVVAHKYGHSTQTVYQYNPNK